MSHYRLGDVRQAVLDQDVFSSYKANHLFSLHFGDTVYHRPWLDTVWYGGLQVQTNEDFNDRFVDKLSAKLGWRQLLKNSEIDIEYLVNRNFRD